MLSPSLQRRLDKEVFGLPVTVFSPNSGATRKGFLVGIRRTQGEVQDLKTGIRRWELWPCICLRKGAGL